MQAGVEIYQNLGDAILTLEVFPISLLPTTGRRKRTRSDVECRPALAWPTRHARCGCCGADCERVCTGTWLRSRRRRWTWRDRDSSPTESANTGGVQLAGLSRTWDAAEPSCWSGRARHAAQQPSRSAPQRCSLLPLSRKWHERSIGGTGSEVQFAKEGRTVTKWRYYQYWG